MIGGQTLIEVPSGRGRTDILILYKARKYIIETKIFNNAGYFERGKGQLADYLSAEGLEEGFYVVFTSKHSASDTLYFSELINGKHIHTWLSRTNFRQRVGNRNVKSRQGDEAAFVIDRPLLLHHPSQ